MKRTNYGIVNSVAILAVDYYNEPIYVLDEKLVTEWKYQKNNLHGEYVAFLFEDKLHFRKLYNKAMRGYSFKFLNRWLYFDECMIYRRTIENGVIVD